MMSVANMSPFVSGLLICACLPISLVYEAANSKGVIFHVMVPPHSFTQTFAQWTCQGFRISDLDGLFVIESAVTAHNYYSMTEINARAVLLPHNSPSMKSIK